MCRSTAGRAHALRAAARRIGMPVAEALALFPRGATDMVAAFSRWADRQMLDRLEAGAARAAQPVAADRIALAISMRFEVLLPWREAVRRGLAVLAMPQNAPLGLRLLYETVDGIWYAAGDQRDRFQLLYKARHPRRDLRRRDALSGSTTARRAAPIPTPFSIAGSPICTALTELRERFEAAAERLPNPLRFFARSAEPRSAARDQPRDVAHLAARPDPASCRRGAAWPAGRRALRASARHRARAGSSSPRRSGAR